MGMGEPMMNLDNVLAACERLPDIGIGHRHTAISTIGWIPGIERLAENPMPIRLALSLHAADEALRTELMPVNERYPLAGRDRRVRGVLRAQAPHGVRRVRDARRASTTRTAQAAQLADILDPRMFKVNLIPYNPTGSAFTGSSPKAIAAFKDELERRGLDATVRLTRGSRHRRRLRSARGAVDPSQRSGQPNPTGGGGATTLTVAWAALFDRSGSKVAVPTTARLVKPCVGAPARTLSMIVTLAPGFSVPS